ncbi:MAG: oxidoreductase, partial [Promethearchaeota archaeon]
IVMPAMHLGYCTNGQVTDRLIEFYKARAQSEIGLIIIGGCYVDRLGKGIESMIGISDDDFIPGLTKFSSTIHGCSRTKIATQLYHSGRYSFKQIIGEVPVSASATYSPFSKQMSRALELEEIPDIIEKFALAAERAKKAGFDAVEIVGSAGYLIDQFLSPLTNKRNDKYGGSFENRLRFPREVIESCKNEIGENVPLILRYSGSDLVAGSNTLKDKVRIAPYLVEAGLDALNVTGGWHESRVPSITMNVPPGVFSYFSREIKKAVDVPVFASNRINDPYVAEDILYKRRADAVCIGRGQIADPEFALKARTGRAKEIRKCLGCNQGCFDSVFLMKPVTCLRNPVASKEGKIKIVKTSTPKNIMIIGGGIAGMECARVASMRGHEVSLYEKNERLGGQALLAARPPGRSDIAEMISWYERILKKLDVRVILNQEVNLDLAKELDPDVIVLATGAKPVRPKIKGIDLPNVYFVWDLLDPSKKIYPGDKVVIIGGGATGVEAALYAAEFGAFNPDTARFLHYFKILNPEEAWQITGIQRKVYVIEMTNKLGSNFGKSTRWVMLQDLRFNGVETILNATVIEIIEQANEKMSILYAVGEQEHEIKDVDTIFTATSIISENSLADELRTFKKVYKIGDARKIGDLLDAIHSGFKLANKL